MRIIRTNYERVWYPHHPLHLDRTQERNYTGESVIETRILFNRAETALITAVLWTVDTWSERMVYPILRLQCRWFGLHSVACRGRIGCYPEER